MAFWNKNNLSANESSSSSDGINWGAISGLAGGVIAGIAGIFKTTNNQITDREALSQKAESERVAQIQSSKNTRTIVITGASVLVVGGFIYFVFGRK